MHPVSAQHSERQCLHSAASSPLSLLYHPKLIIDIIERFITLAAIDMHVDIITSFAVITYLFGFVPPKRVSAHARHSAIYEDKPRWFLLSAVDRRLSNVYEDVHKLSERTGNSLLSIYI